MTFRSFRCEYYHDFLIVRCSLLRFLITKVKREEYSSLNLGHWNICDLLAVMLVINKRLVVDQGIQIWILNGDQKTKNFFSIWRQEIELSSVLGFLADCSMGTETFPMQARYIHELSKFIDYSTITELFENCMNHVIIRWIWSFPWVCILRCASIVPCSSVLIQSAFFSSA